MVYSSLLGLINIRGLGGLNLRAGINLKLDTSRCRQVFLDRPVLSGLRVSMGFHVRQFLPVSPA